MGVDVWRTEGSVKGRVGGYSPAAGSMSDSAIIRPLTMRRIAPLKARLGLFVEWFRQAEQPR